MRYVAIYYLPVDVGIVSIVAFIQTVDGFFFEAGDFLRGLVLDFVQSSFGHHVLVESVPDVQGTALQQVKVARVAGQTFGHNWSVINNQSQQLTTTQQTNNNETLQWNAGGRVTVCVENETCSLFGDDRL